MKAVASVLIAPLLSYNQIISLFHSSLSSLCPHKQSIQSEKQWITSEALVTQFFTA